MKDCISVLAMHIGLLSTFTANQVTKWCHITFWNGSGNTVRHDPYIANFKQYFITL